MREEIIRKIEAIDPISHVDILHMLKRKIGDVLFYDGEIGLALRHPEGTVFAVPFRSEGLDSLYEAMGNERLYCVHSAIMCAHFLEKGYDFNEPCYTFSYYGNPVDEGPYRFRLMTLDEMDLILSHYDSNEKSIRYDIEHDNVFCIEDDEGKVMGFCGFHSEDAMGLLVIFPEYRNRGLGTFMESHVINEALRRGWIPFCNVFVSNKASIALQKKLGLVAGDVLSYWVWPKKEG